MDARPECGSGIAVSDVVESDAGQPARSGHPLEALAYDVRVDGATVLPREHGLALPVLSDEERTLFVLGVSPLDKRCHCAGIERQ